MKTKSGLAAVAVLLGVLSLLAYLGADPDAARTDRALATLSRLEFAHAELERNVLNARVGILRNYDPVNAAVAALHREADALGEDRVDPDGLAALRGAIDQQDQLAESFKTDNALLQNAMAYFGVISGRFGPTDRIGDAQTDRLANDALGGAVTALAAAVLRLTMDTSDIPAGQVDDGLQRVALAPTSDGERDIVRGLLQHGRMLRELLPETERTMTSLHAVPVARHVRELRDAIHRQQAASGQTAGRYRLGLYAVSVLLVALLAALAVQLRRHIRALRRRAMFEHAIRSMSSHFVTVGPSELDQAIEDGLRDIAVLVDAERAYAVSARLPVPVLWARYPAASWPAHWPEQAPLVASSLDTDHDGAAFVPCLGRMGEDASDGQGTLVRAGLRGWICLSDNGFRPDSLTIGFETLRLPLALSPADQGMLRVALSLLTNAMRRVSLVREREALELRLQRARRMETIGAVTSGVAHNFNNIIGAILGYAEMESEGPSPRFNDNLMGIHVAAERGRDLIEQILAFGKRQSGWALQVDVDALLGETVSLLGASLPQGTTVRLGAMAASAAVAGNHAELQQVILNLCSNAAQAMEGEQRTIDVLPEVMRLDRPRRLREGSLSPGGYVRIAVADQGRGMDCGTIARLFEPFFTTRPSGNGLGLATVREIVRRHGGAIDVASAPGLGSRFEVWLPLARRAAPPTAASGVSGMETILILGSDRARLLRDEELVAALGYEPVGFAGAADQVDDLFRRSPGRFDAVLVAPAGTTGDAVALARAARRAAPALPIVLVVGADEVSPDALAGIGGTEIVAEPLSSAELATALCRHLRELRPVSRQCALPLRA